MPSDNAYMACKRLLFVLVMIIVSLSCHWTRNGSFFVVDKYYEKISSDDINRLVNVSFIDEKKGENKDKENENEDDETDDNNFEDELLGSENDNFFNSTINCTKEYIDSETDADRKLLLQANCGSGYDFANDPNKGGPVWRVALYGNHFHATLALSGCPNSRNPGRCPYSPQCRVYMAKTYMDVRRANVVVVTTFDANIIDIGRIAPKYVRNENAHNHDDESDDDVEGEEYANISNKTSNSDISEDEAEDSLENKRRLYRVLYWREPYWFSHKDVQQKYDFQMGIHYQSGLINPDYLRRPETLLNTENFPTLPFSERTHFALSIISKCEASSYREDYIQHLVAILGRDKIHQYGRCGDGHMLPPKPISNAAKVISKYKFFLAFESTIMNGYVTEKLLTTLNMGIVPVYFGAPDVFNITKTPSFINVMDFKSPKKLAEYLVFLSENEEEYNKYHAWRKDPDSFDPNYLSLIAKQAPGRDELEKYKIRSDNPVRYAACCRLCNQKFVEEAAANPKRFYPSARWGRSKIYRDIING